MLRFLSFVLFAIFLSGPVFATDVYTIPGQLPPEVTALFEKEPPLTQKDIDAFARFYPQIQKMTSEEKNGVKVVDNAVFAKEGITPARGSYVFTKVPVVYAVIEVPEEYRLMVVKMGGIPAPLLPNKDELVLVQKNLGRLVFLSTK